MLNKRLFNISLDIIDIKNGEIFLGAVKQYNGTTLKIYLYNDSKLMNLEGASVSLYAITQSGKRILQTEDISIDTLIGLVNIECKPFIFQDVGRVRVECEVVDDDGYLITTPTMIIDVVEKLNDLQEDEVITEDYIDFVNVMIHNESIRTRDEAIRGVNENNRVIEESIREESETNRVLGEETRIENEIIRQDAINQLLSTFEVSEQDIEDILGMINL